MPRLSHILAACSVLLLSSAPALAVPPPNMVNSGNPQLIQRSPAVSPYLALSAFGRTGGVANYYTVVRPLMAQRQINQSNALLIHQLQSRSAQPARVAEPVPVFGGEGRTMIRPTGHPSAFMNHHNYFGGAERFGVGAGRR